MSESLEPFYLEDHELGQDIPGASEVVSEEEIIAFATRWDPQPWHTDRVAAGASMFGGLTACSAHIFAIYCSTSQRWQNGRQLQALAGLGFDELRVLRPVFAGDTLSCVTRVESARRSRSNPGRGIVVYASRLINQRDEEVFTIKSTTLVACRDA